MARKKGIPKTGGRRAGTPNKVTVELRTLIKTFVENRSEQIMKDFDSLKPEMRVKLYLDFLGFCLPRLGTTQLDLNISKLSDEQVKELTYRFIGFTPKDNDKET